MVSIKVKFRCSTVANSEGSIYYQLIKDRKVRQLLTPYKIYPSEWDEKKSTVLAKHGSCRKCEMLSIREQIHGDIERLIKIDRKMNAKGLDYTTDDLIEEYRKYIREYTLFNYLGSIIAKLKQNGKERTSETYKCTLLSFMKFREDKDILLEDINADLIEKYEAWLKQRGNVPNTISFYIRILRAVYNRAVEAEIIDNRHPFRHVYTGIEKTLKRALPIDKVKKIKLLNLTKEPSLDFARDMFMISFYLRGMSFIDMAYLKKEDLCNGYVTYRRRKTGQQLLIKWTKEMQKILDKYPENDSDYLLPVIRNKKANERHTFRNAGCRINRDLKQIGQMTGITIPLTLYVARHSWASAARTKGIPVSVISEGMGHDNETTTRIYLANLETSIVDNANSLIIKALK